MTTKNDITVVTFIGKINKESKAQLMACREQLLTDQAKMVVFYCKEVTSVEPCVFREFTLLQHDVRQRRNEVFVAGLDDYTKQYLVDHAVIRSDENKKTLADVFKYKKTTS